MLRLKTTSNTGFRLIALDPYKSLHVVDEKIEPRKARLTYKYYLT